MELLSAVQAAQGKPDFDEKLTACLSDPIFRDIIEHSRRVALLVGESSMTILALYFALHSYTMEHPDWDPEETGGLC